MTKSRVELDADVDALAAWIPAMLEATDEASQIDAFAGYAELIEDQVGPDDTTHVRDRLQQLLVHHCLTPTVEGPCA
jgi:hypothetical protein